MKVFRGFGARFFSEAIVVTDEVFLVEARGGRTHEGEEHSLPVAVMEDFAVELHIGVISFMATFAVEGH